MPFSLRLLLISIIAIGLFASLFLFLQSGNRVPPEDIESVEYREYWRERIQSVGAQRAYGEFVHETTQLREDFQHFAGHLFGDALHESEGIGGVVICNASFGFSCYHALFGRALADRGVEIIKEFNLACLERYGLLGTGCMHGIGHGILEYFGYDRLVDALEACDETEQYVPILGCTSGVFMEYNTPLNETDDGKLVTAPRPLDPDNVYGACDSVPNRFKESCYFELGSWWELTFGEDWERMAALCGGLPDTKNYDMCMLGVGYTLGNRTGYDTQEIRSVCGEMTTESSVLCRAGAYWMLYANPAHRGDAEILCGSLDDNNKERCFYMGRPDLWVEL